VDKDILMNQLKALATDEIESNIPATGGGSRVWFWVFIAFLVGGGLGWAMGVRSVTAPITETAASQTTTTTMNVADFFASPAPADNVIPSATPLPEVIEITPEMVTAVDNSTINNNASTISIGPTPASITARELTALGNPNAPVTIVEFSDYQCPFCRRHFLETIPQIKANFLDTGQG
jgi:hypothetical protein